MKGYLLFIFFFLLRLAGYGQQVNSYVSGDIAYVNYTVLKSEGVDAIASKYGISNAALLQANALGVTTVLREGQQLKIPITTIIKPACNGGSCIPVYYEVQQSEGLYRIGKNHGNIKVAQLRQLNNLGSESLSKGKQLLIGYLLINTTANEKIPGDGEANKTTLNNGDTTSGMHLGSKAAGPVTAPIKNDAKTTEITNANPKPAATKKNLADTFQLTYKGQGFFESQFMQGSGGSKIVAAPFKSESGFADGKFYALMNGIDVGTILKITNPATTAVVFAKVLGPLPHVKEKNPTQIRISNAAAIALGFRYEELFEVMIAY